MKSTIHRLMRLLSVLLASLLLLLTASCGKVSPGTADEILPEPEPPEMQMLGADTKFTYLCFDMSQNKYAAIAEALAEKCDAQEVELSVIDCGGQDSVFFSVFDDLSEMASDGLIVTAENNNLGPVIQGICATLDLPLLCVETRFRNAEGQSVVSVDYQSRRCGALLGGAIADHVLARGVDISDTTVVMLNMTSELYIKQTLAGVEDVLTERLNLSSANFTMLEVTGSSYEKQHMAMNSFFQKLDPGRNYIFITFNNEGAKAVADYVRESEADGQRVFLGSIGYFEKAQSIFELGDDTSENFITVDISPEEIATSVMELLNCHLKDLQDQSEVMLIPEQVVTWESYQQDLFGE